MTSLNILLVWKLALVPISLIHPIRRADGPSDPSFHPLEEQMAPVSVYVLLAQSNVYSSFEISKLLCIASII